MVVLTETRLQSVTLDMGNGMRLYNCNPDVNESRRMGVAFVVKKGVEVMNIHEVRGRLGVLTVRFNGKVELNILRF